MKTTVTDEPDVVGDDFKRWHKLVVDAAPKRLTNERRNVADGFHWRRYWMSIKYTCICKPTIHTSMFTTLKSSAFFISTAATEQYSCQNWFFLANLIAREYSSTRNGGKSLTWKNTIRMKTKQHCYYFSKTLVVESIFYLRRVELNRLKVHYVVRTYFILMHVFG